MVTSVVLLGAGGHARVVHDVVTLNGLSVVAIADKKNNNLELSWAQVPIVSDQELLEQFSPDSIVLVNGIGSIGSLELRKKIYLQFKKQHYHFTQTIHPRSIVSRDTVLGEGVQVMAGAIIQAGSRVLENTIINTKASIDHDCTIGPHVHIAPGVTLSGGVRIDEGSHIG